MAKDCWAILLLALACTCPGFGQADAIPAPAFVPFAPDEVFDISLIESDPVRRHGLVEHLQAVVRLNRANSARFDMTPAALATADTKDVLLHFIQSPQTSRMGLYSDKNTGIARALYTSATLQEFFRRGDIPSAIVAAYQELDPDPPIGPIYAVPTWRDGLSCTLPKISQLAGHPYRNPEPPRANTAKWAIYGRISCALGALDDLVMYPPLFVRLKASDQALLAVLHERLTKMVAANDRQVRNTGDTAYSYSMGTAFTLVLQLAERSAPALHTVLYEQASRPGLDDHAFVDTLGLYLGVPTPAR